MSRLATSLLAALAGRTPEEELIAQLRPGAVIEDPGTGNRFVAGSNSIVTGFGGPEILSPEGAARFAEMQQGAVQSADGLPTIINVGGRSPEPLVSEDDLIASGAAERDPSTGRLVVAGTGNPMTAPTFSAAASPIARGIIQDRFQDRQKLNRTAQDFSRIRTLLQSKQIDTTIGAQAIEDTVAHSGLSPAQLMEIPDYRWAVAADGEYAEMIQATREAKAQKWGVPVDAINEDASGYDEGWLQGHALRQQEAVIQSTPAITLAEAELSRAEKQYHAELKRIDTVVRALEKGGDSAGAIRYSQQETAAAWERYSNRHEDITGRKVSAQQSVVDARADGSVTATSQPTISHPTNSAVRAVGRATTPGELDKLGASVGDYAIVVTDDQGEVWMRKTPTGWGKANL